MEATVTNVDPIRFVCSVKTVKGQYFNEVPWLLPTGGSGKSGIHFAPSVNDQVVVYTGLTYPIILGALPRLGTPTTSLTNVSGQEVSIDAGNNTVMKNGYVTNPDKPSDFMPGDVVITSDGGGIVASLANGSALIKASSLAQVFVSKFNDLVRVVARNWERFSDVGQQTVANVSGRLYEYLGWDRDLDRSKVGLYELQDVIGDVVAGETLLGDPNSDVTLAAADARVRKYWLQDQSNNNRMVEVLYEDGKVTLLIQDALATTKTTKTTDKNLWDTKVQSPTASSQVVITPASITLTQSGGATTVMDSAGIRSDYSGHYVHIDSSGVHMG